MLIRKVTAPTRQEAYEKLRKELGPDLEIVHAAAHKRGGFFGLFRRQWIEVVGVRNDGVSSDANVEAHPSVRAVVEMTTSGVAEIPSPTLPAEGERARVSPGPMRSPGEADDVLRMNSEISELRETVQKLAVIVTKQFSGTSPVATEPAPEEPVLPPPSQAVEVPQEPPSPIIAARTPVPEEPSREPEVSPESVARELFALPDRETLPDQEGAAAIVSSVRVINPAPPASRETKYIGQAVDHLLETEFRPGLVEEIRQYLEDVLSDRDRIQPKIVKEKATDFLVARLNVGGPLSLGRGEKGKLVALVGPTGVGKTTTLAKLAGDLKFNRKLDVAFITIDTYRIAAPEQLKKYAEIIEVPVKVVFKPEDMIDLAQGFRNKDVILIDTVGRSPRKKEDLYDLKGFLDFGMPIETHLLVSAMTKYSDLREIARAFSGLDYQKILVSKADETATFGAILSLLTDQPAGASYLTTGQCVPDDIIEADAGRLASLAFGRHNLSAQIFQARLDASDSHDDSFDTV